MAKKDERKPIELTEYKDIDINHIIKWCQDNNQVAWLKALALETRPYKVYPKKTIITEDGQKKQVADKTLPYKTEMRPIAFINIKMEFCEKFMPDKLPAKGAKKPNMYDLIASL